MISGRRRLRLGFGLALGLLGSGPACYDLPKPECGFRCGPNDACPEDYTCSASDGRCHLNGSPPTLVCSSPADAGIDATGDAAIDAPIDAAIDAMAQ
jgi:hypothetical protein